MGHKSKYVIIDKLDNKQQIDLWLLNDELAKNFDNNFPCRSMSLILTATRYRVATCKL